MAPSAGGGAGIMAPSTGTRCSFCHSGIGPSAGAGIIAPCGVVQD